MDRVDAPLSVILEQLASLSGRQLDLTLSGEWDAWEDISERKAALFIQVQRLADPTATDEVRRLLEEIRGLEARILEALYKDREETLQALQRIGSRKKAAAYSGGGGAKASERHFGITC